MQNLNKSYRGLGQGGEAARESVQNAARLLRNSPDPAVRSAAGRVLAKLGGPTRELANDPVLKAGGKASLVVGMLLNIAEYSSEHDSIVEIASRTALNAAGGFFGGILGDFAAGFVCPLIGVPDAGIATVACEGTVIALGSVGGEVLGEKVGDAFASVVWDANGMPSTTAHVLFILPQAEPGPAPTPPPGG